MVISVGYAFPIASHRGFAVRPKLHAHHRIVAERVPFMQGLNHHWTPQMRARALELESELRDAAASRCGEPMRFTHGAEYEIVLFDRSYLPALKQNQLSDADLQHLNYRNAKNVHAAMTEIVSRLHEANLLYGSKRVDERFVADEAAHQRANRVRIGRITMEVRTPPLQLDEQWRAAEVVRATVGDVCAARGLTPFLLSEHGNIGLSRANGSVHPDYLGPHLPFARTMQEHLGYSHRHTEMHYHLLPLICAPHQLPAASAHAKISPSRRKTPVAFSRQTVIEHRMNACGSENNPALNALVRVAAMHYASLPPSDWNYPRDVKLSRNNRTFAQACDHLKEHPLITQYFGAELLDGLHESALAINDIHESADAYSYLTEKPPGWQAKTQAKDASPDRA